jgi:hypothetical protein
LVISRSTNWFGMGVIGGAESLALALGVGGGCGKTGCGAAGISLRVTRNSCRSTGAGTGVEQADASAMDVALELISDGATLRCGSYIMRSLSIGSSWSNSSNPINGGRLLSSSAKALERGRAKGVSLLCLRGSSLG